MLGYTCNMFVTTPLSAVMFSFQGLLRGYTSQIAMCVYAIKAGTSTTVVRCTHQQQFYVVN